MKKKERRYKDSHEIRGRYTEWKAEAEEES